MADAILVTGAAGLLGRAVSSLLCSSGASVIALVRKFLPDFLPAAQQCVIDLSKNWNPRHLPKKIDVVIHLAQSNRFRDFPEGATDLFGVNVSATAKLLEYARRAGAKRFIYASTGGLYAAKGVKLAENSPILEPDKLGAYFASKLCGEIMAQSYSGFMGITILRPFFIFGADQKRNMLIPKLYDSVQSGQPIYLAGDTGIRINPIHAHDAAEAVIAAISDPASAIINIAGAEIYSIREIAQHFGRHLGRDPVFSVQHGSKQEDLIADISLMRSRLAEPRKSLLNSLSEIAPQSI